MATDPGGRRVGLARTPTWWVQVFAAMFLVAALNAGAIWLWGSQVPWLSLFAQPEMETTDIAVPDDTTTPDLVPAAFSPGLDFAQQVVSLVPSPGAGFREGDVAEWPLRLGAATACPADSDVAPVAVAQRAWREADGGGVTAQVQILPAGTGAIAFEEAVANATGCPGVTVSSSVGSTLSYRLNSGGWDGEYVLRRDGDMLAMLATTKNSPDLTDLMNQWQEKWDKPLGSVCLDRDAPASAGTRQPLLPDYVGLVEERTIRLASPVADRLMVEATDEWVALNEGKMVTPIYETVPLPEPEPLPEIPDGVAVALDDAPQLLSAPVPPGPEPVTEPYSGPAEDVEGPGCGWQWLSQPRPTFDAAAAEVAWATSRVDATALLERTYFAWAFSGYDYAEEIESYQRRIDWYNRWVGLVFDRVVVANWEAYREAERLYRLEQATYRADRAAYVRELAAWQQCKRLNPEPTPVPVPTPTPAPTPVPTPTPTPWVDPCGDAPVVPEAPVAPEMPETGKPTAEQRARAALTAEDVKRSDVAF